MFRKRRLSREIDRVEAERAEAIGYAKRARTGHKSNALAEVRRLTTEALRLEVRT